MLAGAEPASLAQIEKRGVRVALDHHSRNLPSRAEHLIYSMAVPQNVDRATDHLPEKPL